MWLITSLSAFLFTGILCGCASSRTGDSTGLDGVLGAAPAALTRTILLSRDANGNSEAVTGALGHLAYDEDNNRIFATAPDVGRVLVIDLKAGKVVQQISGLKQPVGIALNRTDRCLVVACRGENAIHVYSLSDLKEVAVAHIGENADTVDDTGTSCVYVGFGSDHGPGGLAVYDTNRLRVDRIFPLPCRPGSYFPLGPVMDAALLMIILPGHSHSAFMEFDELREHSQEIADIDGPIEDPTASSSHWRFFYARRNPTQLVSTIFAKETGRAPCVADVGDIFYDFDTKRVMVIGGGTSNSEKSPGAEDGGALEIFQSYDIGLSRIARIPTGLHARTGLFIRDRQVIYVACPAEGGQDAKILEFSLRK